MKYLLLFVLFSVSAFGQCGVLVTNPLTGLLDCTGAAGAGSGTVTSVSVTTANGVSGTVATATTTPAITITLGAITPTTVNGLTITSSASGVLTIAAGKTVTVSNTLTFTGTDTSSVAFGAGGTIIYAGSNVTWTGTHDFTAASVSLASVFLRSDTGYTMTAGQKAVANPNSTTAGFRIVCGTLPTPVGGLVAGDESCDASGRPYKFDGTNQNVLLGFAGSGAAGALPGAGILHVAGSTNLVTSSLIVGTDITAATIPASKMAATTWDAQTDAATITWAIASVLNAQATVTLGGNRTLNITNPVVGGNYVFKITQDGTGSRTLTKGTGCTFKELGSNAATFGLSTAAGTVDVLTFTFDGTNCYANVGKDYK